AKAQRPRRTVLAGFQVGAALLPEADQRIHVVVNCEGWQLLSARQRRQVRGDGRRLVDRRERIIAHVRLTVNFLPQQAQQSRRAQVPSDKLRVAQVNPFDSLPVGAEALLAVLAVLREALTAGTLP